MPSRVSRRIGAVLRRASPSAMTALPIGTLPMPAHPAVLSCWTGRRKAIVSPHSMYGDAPNQATLDKLALDMKTAVLAFGGPYVPMTATERPQTKGELDSVIWSDMLDLIYSGHADLAATLFDQGWPAEVKGKRDFWRDFVEKMKVTWLWTPWELSKVLDPEMMFARGVSRRSEGPLSLTLPPWGGTRPRVFEAVAMRLDCQSPPPDGGGGLGRGGGATAIRT